MRMQHSTLAARIPSSQRARRDPGSGCRLSIEPLEGRVLLTAYAVTTLADSGAGSLRRAINDANAHAGADTIVFDLRGTGVHTINIRSSLPAITDTLDIEGPVETSASAVPGIELNGGGAVEIGLDFTSSNNRVYGLTIDDFWGQAIHLEGGGHGSSVFGCFLGTDSTGMTSDGDDSYGIAIDNSNDDIIGGAPTTALGDGIVFTQVNRNVIAGYQLVGLIIGASKNTTVAYNLIGTNKDGSAALGGNYGISLGDLGTTNGITITHNVISGNSLNGISTEEIHGAVSINNNMIGTDATGQVALGNGLYGIDVGSSELQEVTGAQVSISSNIISDSGSTGVVVSFENNVSILSNSIYNNGGLGIDLNNDGVTHNDLFDADGGANESQNFPRITSATATLATLGNPGNPGSTVIQGTLESMAFTHYRLQFFSNTSADPSGHGEGRTFLGETGMDTVFFGLGSFTFTYGHYLAPGTFITATATDPNGNTSEFSVATKVSLVSILPPTGVVGSGSAPSTVADFVEWLSGISSLGQLSSGDNTLDG